jgi:hypothetical protein
MEGEKREMDMGEEEKREKRKEKDMWIDIKRRLRNGRSNAT